MLHSETWARSLGSQAVPGEFRELLSSAGNHPSLIRIPFSDQHNFCLEPGAWHYFLEVDVCTFSMKVWTFIPPSFQMWMEEEAQVGYYLHLSFRRWKCLVPAFLPMTVHLLCNIKYISIEEVGGVSVQRSDTKIWFEYVPGKLCFNPFGQRIAFGLFSCLG